MAGAATTPAIGRPPRARAPIAWDELRAGFPIFERLHFLDTAYYNPLAERVRGAVNGFYRDIQSGSDPGTWKRVQGEARRAVARLIGVRPDQIALVKNTSEGINAIAHALPLRPGDAVLTSAFEHPVNLVPWLHLRERGVAVRCLEDERGRATVDGFRAAIDGATRVLVVSAVQYVSGHRADLAGLAELARSAGAYLVVDGIQAVGAADLDVAGLGIDAMACGGHKWLMATHGVGFLYASDRVLEVARPGWLAEEGLEPGTRPEEMRIAAAAPRFEFGNANYAGLAGLVAAVELLEDCGVARIEARVRGLVDHLLEASGRLGVAALTPREPAHRLGIATFRLPEPAAFCEGCGRAGVRVALRRGMIRASLHAYNDASDIDALVEMMRSWKGGAGARRAC